ncbi:M36 family metallopeptidase [Nocardioides lentus]|uniref:M36 family metallopeptidase n=1 Tax=Nocardioides lentus TaxID=338077 RepID=UPI0031DF3284
MTPRPLGRPRLGAVAVSLLVAAAIPGLTPLPALSQSATTASAAALPTDDTVTLADAPRGLEDLDVRGLASPSPAQRAAAERLGLRVTWNRFGTAASVSPAGGSDLGAATGGPVDAARAWLGANRSLLGVSAEVVQGLELVNDAPLQGSSGRAVLLRQTFGGGEDRLASARGGLVSVGIARGRVEYVSSSLVKAAPGALADAPTLDPGEGWRLAAEYVGLDLAGDALDGISESVDDAAGVVGSLRPWTRLDVPGLLQEQQARVSALAGADGTVRPVIEANVVDVVGGEASAYTVVLDAVSGRVLLRENQVEHAGAPGAAAPASATTAASPVATQVRTVPFQGSVTATSCGPEHPFTLTDGATRTVTVAATTVVPVDDITVTLLDEDGTTLASQDLLTSPEVLTYSPGTAIPAGDYAVRICPFDADSVPGPGAYTGVVQTSDTAAPGGGTALPLPRYRFFPANPDLDWSPDTVAGGDFLGCWTGNRSQPGGNGRCDLPSGPLEQPFSAPWDVVRGVDVPSFTTLGNNASTAEAWASPLTPGGLMQRPFSAFREYDTEFTDAWNNARCNPDQLVPGGNDIEFAVTNLNVGHNRMHDYSYGLGFTERNYNMQVSNLGRNTDPTRAQDPEVGNVQAGAITGSPATTGLGRTNANQITLQDGIPGITNQYLFQPLAGAFYAPCADGALDFGIAGHEYTHAITNRMVAGPDEGLTSEHGGAMGESWSDLVAAEYVFSHGYDAGTRPWVLGAYATGNRVKGIRDYAIDRNPLNFSNYGFDTTGDEVHADGEIWNGTMWEVRQALVDRYQSRFPYGDRNLQLRCAQGSGSQSPSRPIDCPGNRRWVQLMFDSFLLQANGAVSMLDMRDAFLAADRIRFDGANAKPIWDAFARRGMGEGASVPGPDSGDTRPSFASPRSENARVTFRTPAPGRIYVGDYEARSTPYADTLGGTPLAATKSFAPGRYELVYVSPGRGATRFSLTVAAGQRRTVTVAAPANLAAASRGASVLAASEGSLTPEALIDGTEGTNWAGISSTDVDTGQSPFVTVDLAGGTQTVRRVQVSALLRPAAAEGETDPESGSRFTALRRFALEACTSRCDSPGATFRRFYTSPADAFPALRPRPVAPDLTLRSFPVTPTRAAAIRMVALENQCTGFSGYAGEQDDDPTNATDCKTASDRGRSVRAAELQVY